jgi:hypothetical protein
VRAGLKTIIFVTTKRDAVGTATSIDAKLEPVTLDVDEQALLDALGIELGDRSHAVFGNGGFAGRILGPNNGLRTSAASASR